MINDPEIDLTEHRDFGNNILTNFRINNAHFSNYIQEVVRKRIYGDEIPWNVVPIYADMYQFDGLIALGNSEQRENEIKIKYWGCVENLFCNCCGKKYLKIPWNDNSGLCKRCQEAHYKVNNRI